MRKLLIAIAMLMVPVVGLPAGGGDVHLDEVYINLRDKASLQRGAKLFSNYCLSCHSAEYSRYNRVGRDLGISDENVKENLMFAGDKVGDLMKTTMPVEDAQKWFGVAPPDLSLIARSKDPDWIYTYMKSFYIDDDSPSGWNNTVFENVAMPNVLFELQGNQRAVYETHGDKKAFAGFEMEEDTGSMSAVEFDQSVTDLVNYLVYLAEPAGLKRHKLGVFVLLFLIILLIPCYLMKKEYWRDVH